MGSADLDARRIRGNQGTQDPQFGVQPRGQDPVQLSLFPGGATFEHIAVSSRAGFSMKWEQYCPSQSVAVKIT